MTLYLDLMYLYKLVQITKLNLQSNQQSYAPCTLLGVFVVLSPVSENWPPKNVEVNASGLGKYFVG